MRSWAVYRWLGLVGVLTTAAGVVGVLGTGAALVAPTNHIVGAPPADLQEEAVEFPSETGGVLRGWFVPGDTGLAGIVLVHGIRSDRRSMVERAQFLTAAGYSVLLFDLPAHGGSPGDRITFGYRESSAVRTAIRYLRGRVGGTSVGAIGSSLGGAACLLGREPVDVDALVLEAVYADLESATENRLRLRLGTAGAWLAPLLTWQVEGRLGISLKDLRPVDAIAHCRSPVLIISGTLDRHTTVNDTKALFASAHEPKELWLVSGAAHVDLYGFANEEYRRRILKFFSRHLGSARSMSASIGLPVSSARSLAEYCHVVRGKGDHDQSINPQAAVRRPPGVRGTRVEAGGSRIPPNLAPSTGLLQTRSAQVMRARWACPPSRQTSSSVELWRLGPQSLRMRQPHSVRTQAGRSRSLPRPAG